MKYSTTLLSSAIALSLAFAAQAQDNNDPQATDLDAVQVVGIRASLEKSLDTKRNNTGISEAITAEDIGKFPSTNVAEALSQIPGVTLTAALARANGSASTAPTPASICRSWTGIRWRRRSGCMASNPAADSITPCWHRRSWGVWKFSNPPKRV